MIRALLEDARDLAALGAVLTAIILLADAFTARGFA